jgi:uncharacterized protein YjbI with pentapeptide repeats
VADQKQLIVIRRGVDAWNEWRRTGTAHVDLRGATLRGMDLTGANLRGGKLSSADFTNAKLSGANLHGADLHQAQLGEANLRGANLYAAKLVQADLHRADLTEANVMDAKLMDATLAGAVLREAKLNVASLRGANLRDANLFRANCRGADLSSADLSGARLGESNLSEANLNAAILRAADLTGATLIKTNLERADLTGARVFGVAAWGVKLHEAIQQNLVVTDYREPNITADNLEVAQFIYLLLNNENIRAVIDTITSKAVLLLGRFSTERKKTLDLLRDGLRARNYLPIVIDFEIPVNRDVEETMLILASMSRFVIADLTDPRSLPQELASIVYSPLLVPIRPIILKGQEPWEMFKSLSRRPHVLEPFRYTDNTMLLNCLVSDIIEPAERKARELAIGNHTAEGASGSGGGER